MIIRNKMPVKIGILNCYSDEPKSAPSAQLFADNISNTKIINHCHGEKINGINLYDGYIISGSRSCHLDQDNWIVDLQQLIKNIHKKNIPCLAVCFGHQVVAHTFGGNTVRNLASVEGFQNVPTKTGEEQIRLFEGLSNPVKVYQSHNDAVMKAPPGSFQVIHNNKCVQYYQYGSIHSIQSHPEISIQTAVKIAERDNQNITEILNGINEKNIQSHKILNNFIKIVQRSKK